MSATNQPFDIRVAEKFEQDGETKTSWTTVGVAFQHRNGNGFNCRVKPGIALTGEFTIFERLPKESS